MICKHAFHANFLEKGTNICSLPARKTVLKLPLIRLKNFLKIKNDLVSYPAHVEDLGKYIIYM